MQSVRNMCVILVSTSHFSRTKRKTLWKEKDIPQINALFSFLKLYIWFQTLCETRHFIKIKFCRQIERSFKWWRKKSATMGKKSQLRIVTIGMREGNAGKYRNTETRIWEILSRRGHFRHETNFNLSPMETYRVEWADKIKYRLYCLPYSVQYISGTWC
jgi:hypothetical protein